MKLNRGGDKWERKGGLAQFAAFLEGVGSVVCHINPNLESDNDGHRTAPFSFYKVANQGTP